MSSYPILKIEGINEKNALKLGKVGVKTTKGLIDKAITPKNRAQLAQTTGIDEKKLLQWANKADLMRIKGIGEEYSDLLEAAGVDTVKELKMRKPEHLLEAVTQTNLKKKLVRQLPSLILITDWINQAKTLPPTLKY